MGRKWSMWSIWNRTWRIFIRLNVAKEICTLMKYQNLEVKKAAQIVIDRLGGMDADGGVIVLDNKRTSNDI